MSGLNEFLHERGLEAGECLAPATVEAFVNESRRGPGGRGARARRVAGVACSVGRFHEYLGGLGDGPRAGPAAKPAEPLLDDYLAWMAEVRQSAPATLILRRRRVRHFLRWLGPQANVEGLGQLRRESIEQFFLDYAEQVCALLEAARALGPADSLRPHTIETFLGLLYTTGMRTGEALGLNLEDVHSDRQALYIRQGKFRKDRWLPLEASTSRALHVYLQRRTRHGPNAPGDPLLINTASRRLSDSSARQALRQLLECVGIPHRKGHGPRLHDFRHTFAEHRLLDWYRDGQDLHARLPALATYLGHVDLRSTQVYLQLTPELLEQVNQRFHTHFLNHVQPQGAPS